MTHHQVISRRYRPQCFSAVRGQDATVATLKNAIRSQRLAHAYLFCGMRGTGKTSLARLFAKALNCTAPTEQGEPCCHCSSCREIAQGSSLDVLEIDGASHRGIEDVRQINETVGYTSSSGQYKIYIIDEVHMLTKEAFNALLKTLEEPPPKVVFLFATTEPHKLPSTILSRCQRFNLRRVSFAVIAEKLRQICIEQSLEADETALQLLAKRAEGGFRDAESLLEQALTFGEGKLTAEAISELLGLMPSEVLFSLDRAGHRGDLAMAFTVSEQLFLHGRDLGYFVDMLISHVRTLLAIKVGIADSLLSEFSEEERSSYLESAGYYTQEQCMELLDMFVEAQPQLRLSSVPRFALEALLLRLIRSHRRIPVDLLVRRLTELEERVRKGNVVTEAPMPAVAPIANPSPPIPQPSQSIAPVQVTEEKRLPQSRYDTLFQFAAVELEGSLQIKRRLGGVVN